MLFVLFSLKVNTHTSHASEVLSKEKIVPADVYALLKSGKFWAFCMYIAGVARMMFIAEQQFSRYFVTFLTMCIREMRYLVIWVLCSQVWNLSCI